MSVHAAVINRPPIPEVDVPTAKELFEQIHEHIAPEEIARLTRELEGKVSAMRRLLLAPELDSAGVRSALELTFVARRRASAILGARDDRQLTEWVSDLLQGGDPLPLRLERFCAAAGPLAGPRAAELASELLHFTEPHRHWLWTRWIWSSESRTGALALLIGEQYELDGDGLGATYARVCEALEALDASPEAGAFRRGATGRLATDLLLACTYSVYMRTVLGLKMTQEFNALVPPMPQLVRRLLGIYHHKEA